MKQLIKAAFGTRKSSLLLFFTMLAMIVLSIASQIEIISLGLLINNPTSIGSKTAIKQGSGFLDQISMFFETHFHFYSDFRVFIFVLALVSIFKAASLFASRFLSELVGIKVSRDLRRKYFEHIQTLSMDFYHKHDIGMLSSRVVGDAGYIANSIAAGVVNYIQLPFTAFTTVGTCIYMSYQMSLIVFLCLPVVISLIVIFSKRVRKAAKKLFLNQEKFSLILLDFLSGVQNVKLFCKEEFLAKKYNEKNQNMAKGEVKAAKYAHLLRPILHLITTLFLGVFVFIGIMVFHMSIPDLLVFCGLLYLFYEPIKRFAEENAKVQRGVVAAKRLFDILEFQPSIVEKKDPIVLQELNNSIEFKHVWFRYQDQYVLKDMSFKVNKGQMAAIVGATGGGKSSIASLLPRLYEIEKGEILFDGKSIKDFEIASLRKQMAFVTQKPFFFSGSVIENITFGEPYAKEKVIEACKQAQAHEFIEKLDQGYETILEEGGKNLSGGQQQRLSLARALLKENSILVLDEATSQLDNLSEAKLKAVLESFKGKVTQIVIAHRLHLIEKADVIFVIDHGELIGQGTKEELLKSCPLFASMVNAHSEEATLSVK